MKVLIAASGTRGDLQPSFVLAQALKRAGHEATISAAPTHQRWAESIGVPFVASGIDVESFMREYAASGAGEGARATAAGLRLFFERDIPGHLEALEPQICEADMVVGVSLQVAAREICRARGKPYCHLAFSSQMLPSSEHPPALVPRHGLPRWANALLWRAIKRLRGGMVIGPANAIRRRLGLKPYDRFPYMQETVALNLVASDAALDPIPSDVRARFRQTGFLFFEQAEPLSTELEAFLKAGPPPVYFGFGSMAHPDPRAVMREILDAVARVRCRALLSSRWAGFGAGQKTRSSSVMVIGAVPHRQLFPRVAAAVHHGGAGTTAAAALAGIPQLLVPHLLDQHMWARIVEQRGLGPRAIPIQRLTAGRLAHRLRRLLEAPAYRAAAQGMKSRLALDGARAAVDALTDFAVVPAG